jgi:hypothetical protein
MSNRLIDEVKGVNQVRFDISSKPPSTIEWEKGQKLFYCRGRRGNKNQIQLYREGAKVAKYFLA